MGGTQGSAETYSYVLSCKVLLQKQMSRQAKNVAQWFQNLSCFMLGLIKGWGQMADGQAPHQLHVC